MLIEYVYSLQIEIIAESMAGLEIPWDRRAFLQSCLGTHFDRRLTCQKHLRINRHDPLCGNELHFENKESSKERNKLKDNVVMYYIRA